MNAADTAIARMSAHVQADKWDEDDPYAVCLQVLADLRHWAIAKGVTGRQFDEAIADSEDLYLSDLR